MAKERSQRRKDVPYAVVHVDMLLQKRTDIRNWKRSKEGLQSWKKSIKTKQGNCISE